MNTTDRLRLALLALARGETLTTPMHIVLAETGWANATQKDAQRELEEQAKRLVQKR
jgi:hypothetical protein